jgi:hypothetical protein
MGNYRSWLLIDLFLFDFYTAYIFSPFDAVVFQSFRCSAHLGLGADVFDPGSMLALLAWPPLIFSSWSCSIFTVYFVSQLGVSNTFETVRAGRVTAPALFVDALFYFDRESSILDSGLLFSSHWWRAIAVFMGFGQIFGRALTAGGLFCVSDFLSDGGHVTQSAAVLLSNQQLRFKELFRYGNFGFASFGQYSLGTSRHHQAVLSLNGSCTLHYFYDIGSLSNCCPSLSAVRFEDFCDFQHFTVSCYGRCLGFDLHRLCLSFATVFEIVFIILINVLAWLVILRIGSASISKN